MTETENKTSNNTGTEEGKKTNLIAVKEDEFKVPALVWHALSAIASMGGTYLLFIKPIEDFIKELEEKLNKDSHRINQLEEENEQIKNQLKKITKRLGVESGEVGGEDNNYELLSTKRTMRQLSSRRQF